MRITRSLQLLKETTAAVDGYPQHALQQSQAFYVRSSAIQHHHIDYTLYGHLIQHCGDNRLVRQGKQLHSSIVISSTTPDNFIASKLITFYSKIHNLHEARHVFDQIPYKNTFSWNALLIGYSLHNDFSETLRIFLSFLRANSNSMSSKPDKFTISCVLKSLSVVSSDSVLAKMIHCYVTKNGFNSDNFVLNGMITYYSRCGDMVSARCIFDVMAGRDLVSWNSMISGYSQGGLYEECKKLYMDMLALAGLRPNGVTALSVLQACAQSNDLALGMEVHKYVIENDIDMDISVCNSLIALYAKCGTLDYARELFEEMSEKDDITYGTIISGYMAHGFVDKAVSLFREMRNPGLSIWNAVISGQAQNNRQERVIDLLREMQECGLKPNCVTISSILPAVPSFSSLKGGKEIHAYAIRSNYDKNIYVATAIIDTYGKLGFIDGAQRVFDQAKVRSVIIWTAIISACAAHADVNAALSLFEQMLNHGIQPDPVTFTAVLAACARAGLVSEAWEIFSSLLPKYGIEPLVEHYACMVGVLSRGGKLSEAVRFINEMPFAPTAKVWGALLNEASVSGDLELGKFICDHLFEMEPQNTGNYIVLANLYSKAGRWEEAEEIRIKMKNIGLTKFAGSSWI